MNFKINSKKKYSTFILSILILSNINVLSALPTTDTINTNTNSKIGSINDDYLTISIVEADYNHEYLIGSDILLEELKSRIDNEWTETSGTFTINNKPNENSFKTAESLARYFWAKLLPQIRTTPPFPCGTAVTGDIEVKSSNDLAAQIHGIGDGMYNTCLETGSPGYWDYYISINLNPDHKIGTFKIRFTSE